MYYYFVLKSSIDCETLKNKFYRIKLLEVPANNVAKATAIQAFEPLAGNFPKVTEKKAVHEIPKTENFWKVIQK